MAFKQKLPVLAGAVVLAGGFLAILLVRPPEEDRLAAAVRRHAGTLGPVREIRIHDSIADICLDPDGKVVHAEFALRDGEWVFVKDVGQEFVDYVRAPERELEALQRLGRRLSDQLKMEVTLKEGLRVEIQVGRDEHGLCGRYQISFAFPKSGDRPPQRGRYVEVYYYRNGRWTLEGTTGRLMLEAVKGD